MPRVPRQVIAILVALTALYAAPSVISAQELRGSLLVEVQDSSGGAIPAAQITLADENSATRLSQASDSRGEVHFPALSPSTYSLEVTAKGFAAQTQRVAISISAHPSIRFVLAPESLRQSVEVRDRGPSLASHPLDTASSTVQTVITADDIDEIPLSARSFANISLMAPFTAPVEPSDPTKARITAVSFGGGSGLNVELSVDGGDNNDDYIGGFLQNFSPDAIEEFAVRTSQEDADTGRTVGGSVVITTKSGTNFWHASGGFYGRASALNARFPIDNPAPDSKQPFSRQNYIATLGGPIQRDKSWMFASFEAVNEHASISYSPASLTQFNALAALASQGLIQGVNREGQRVGLSSIAVPSNTPVPFHDYMGSARLDWAQSGRSQWFLRASIDNYTTRNDLVQQATLPSTGATSGSNYLNLALGNQFTFSPSWLGSFTFDASGLHHTESRNSQLGFALAFPFSATFQTISGFETFGDNQFATPITAFPVLRNQEKYQFRYDVSHSSGKHSPKFGINFIHEPVLSGALSGTEETLITYPNNPDFYAANPGQFYFDPTCLAPAPDPGIGCAHTPEGDGSFSQSLQRLGLYAQDSWRVTSHLTVNYGLRYDTTFGLFQASSRNQLQNPAYRTLKALGIPLINGTPHDDRRQFGPRLGIAYAPGNSEKTVLRAGVGLYYNDLAQNGWVGAFRAVNAAPGPCTDPVANPGGPENAGCLPGSSAGGQGAIIDQHYQTPYALQASAGIQRALNERWTVSADWTHENGTHAYRAYPYTGGVNLFTPQLAGADPAQADFVPNLDVYKTDNRSSYDGLSVHLQGNMSRAHLIANYTLARAKTWGCTVGELFDYVNGVCDPVNAFAPGDYGPSGEDVRHRFVLAGTVHAPFGFELTTLTQVESARPFTLANGGGRAVINGVKTTLDQFRGTPYAQVDLRVSRSFQIGERMRVHPFVEFFNLLNRNNPSNNFVADVAGLPVPASQVAAGNITDLCGNSSCSTRVPITSLGQLRKPAGALGDFFGPGTTVGIPFAAQFGVRVSF